MAHTLPQETLDGILDFLHDDRPTLLTCTLTSSRFLPSCRYHLFYSITLKTSAIDTFLRLVDAPWCTFASSIKKLVITGDKTCSPRASRRASRDQDYLTGSVAHESLNLLAYIPQDYHHIQTQLEGVESISFSNISLEDVSHPFWSVLCGMKGVRNINLNRTILHSRESVFVYLTSLPKLRSLSISAVTLPIPEDDREAKSTPLWIYEEHGPLLLPLLDIRRASHCMEPTQHQAKSGSGNATAVIVEGLLAQGMAPVLQIIKMDLACERGILEPLGRLLQLSGPTVRELWMTLPSSVLGLRSMSSVDFSHLTQVEAVYIEDLRIVDLNSTRALETCFRTIFSQLFQSDSPPPLRKVTIGLCIDSKASAHSFFGIPDYILLQTLTWCSLPSILAETMTSYPQAIKKLEVNLNIKAVGISVSQRAFAEGYLRGGAWKGFSERGMLGVAFLPAERGLGELEGTSYGR